MKTSLIKVYSHPRSGTAFIAQTLKNNFFEGRDVGLPQKGKWGHWSARADITAPIPYGQLCGNHNSAKKMSQKLLRNPIVYIYRDVRAVALSVWRSENFLNPTMKAMPFSEYLRTPLDWQDTPGRRVKNGKVIAQHWLDHVRGWSKMSRKKKNILLVRYEDLLVKPQEVVDEVAKKFERPTGDVKKVEKLVGISPNEGRIMSWQEYFTEDDLEYLYSVVPRDCPFLYVGE
jgi:hypothetical protein